MPKVSVCIPAYNQVNYLKIALNSVLLQTFTDYEVIVTDDTPGPMVKELIDQFDFGGKLHYFKNQVSLGSPQNWNEAIEKSSGEYVKILHHDDWFEQNDSLEKYVKLLDDNSGCGMAFSASLVKLENGRQWVHEISDEDVAEISRSPASLFLGNKIGSPSAVIFRKTVFEPFDPNLKWLVDIEFYIRVIGKNAAICYCSEALITTFGATGRVSDICIDNPDVEIFENFYVFDKIKDQFSLNRRLYLGRCLGHLLLLCRKYKISAASHIRRFGYTGRIPFRLLIWLKFGK
ncbi:glycosyltransferase family 2 protein [Mucilaginibacter flavidus]|uniref:glycosyltransferase family 2 protein n=1 Tax=Mucilaginibacter flavidus TaxID=2949309 RepID=UPI002093ACFA|nr:glycosyltransferase [Mucilaginibacter flavidus]MCO5947661.1 glycosyltransferase [Mucilaginibacter flavidus]